MPRATARRRKVPWLLTIALLGVVVLIPSLPSASADVPNAGAVELEGLRNARVYNPKTNRWEQQGNMQYGRWYPTLVKLEDGKVLVASGVTKLVKNNRGGQVNVTETFDPKTGNWTTNRQSGPCLPTAEGNHCRSLPLFPRLKLTPSGKVFYGGNGQSWGPFGQSPDEATWSLRAIYDPQAKAWNSKGVAMIPNRSGAADATLTQKPPYDKMSMVVAGGAMGPSPDSLLAIKKTEITTVDKNDNVTSEMGGDMHWNRWFTMAVTLPTGEVVATSGGDKDEVIDPGSESPVEQAEIFNPDTKQWRDAALPHRERTYHNTATLLPDASVLVSGAAPIPNSYTHHQDLPASAENNTPPGPQPPPADGANNDRDSSMEIYYPPYLFKGRRPEIDGAPAGIRWDSTFTIKSHDASSVKSVVLSSLPASTHVHDGNAKTIALKFTRHGDSLTAEAPPSGKIAPPGGYYLFINGTSTGKGHDDNGDEKGKKDAKESSSSDLIPSVARIVKVGEESSHRDAIQPVPDQGRMKPSPGGATPTQDSFGRPPAEPDPTNPGVPPVRRTCQACNPNDGAEPDKPATPMSQGATLGAFSKPFEEGGAAQPRCHRREPDDYILCKPTIGTVAPLIDGTLLFADNLSGTENAINFTADGGETSRNSPTRHLDLRGGRIRFLANPVPEDGGAVNPNIEQGNPHPIPVPNPSPTPPGENGLSDPGVLRQPAPDDNERQRNDGDIFCGFPVQLADGRILIAGGTDWYNDPGVSTPPASP